MSMQNIFSLLFFFTILTVGAVIIRFLRKGTGNQAHYKPKGPSLLNNGELAFFKVLYPIVQNNFYICPKVRIADIVSVNHDRSDKEFWHYLGKISQKHVDYVLCNRQDFLPRLIIELDGGSHNSKSRSDRDNFVDSVFEQTNIPILHIPTQQNYDSNELTQKINEKLSSTSVS